MKRLVLLLFVVSSLSVLPGQTYADGRSNWLAEFYDNPFLIGTPVTTNVNAVSFDWQAGAPVTGVSADNFSARFTTREDFPAGVYRFFARADDEVRVRVDSQTLIDTFDAPQVGTVLSQDISLAAGTHEIQVDYREVTGDAYVFITWEPVSNLDSNVPNFPAVTTTSESVVNISPWLGQYYANPDLSGFPSAIFSESAIQQDWGRGSPVPSIPADNFSVRWTASPTLEAGRYRFNTRVDDGVRVFVDGRTVIDRWDGAVGQLITQDVDLAAGQHNIVVEYYEAGGEAYIELSLTSVSEIQSQPTSVPAVKLPSDPAAQTNATGTVDAYRLNVRAAPSTDASIVTKVERGESYPIIGRNADDSWWQIDANGTAGWVFADFLIATNTSQVPVTSTSRTSQDVTGTGLILTATGTVNLRSSPSRAGAVLGLLPRGAQAEIIGRNSTGTWIQVNYNGTIAWVSQSFVDLPVATSEIPPAP